MNRIKIGLLAVLTVASTVVGSAATPAAAALPVPHYDHIFVIVEENHGFTDIIGNPAAPNLNALANQFGLATQYFGISHPSEPNYVGFLGGNTFGVADDNPYWLNSQAKPSLISQLDHAGVPWKAYLQAVPHAGYQGMCYPARCIGTPDSDPLYVSKHNAIQNYTTSLNANDWSRQVPIEQLADDLASGNVPAFNYVIPDECHDQHGDPPYCLDSGNPFDPQDQHLVALGDEYLGQLVASITGASFWPHGNNAIAVIYDEGDDNVGCCDAGNSDPNGTGGGRVATVVVTSHGPRGLQDATPYNHYSLLQTIQRNFGLPCLEFTCDTANVTPLAPLFAVTGASAIATHALDTPDFATPTPTPNEPVSLTTHTNGSGGWTVVRSPLRGTNDNSLGGAAADTPNDVWAVGNFLPDTTNSNHDATLSLAVHFDGNQWSVTPTPNAGPNFNTLFGVAAAGGQAWAVGVHLNADFKDRSLIESWDGADWHIVDGPQPGLERDMLYSAAALSTSNVWAVGQQQSADGKFETLVEHWNGASWSVVSSPNPGVNGNHLYAVSAASANDIWAVGQQIGASYPDESLIEHWNGSTWSVVASPSFGTANAALYAVTAKDGQVWAAGETIDAVKGGHALVAKFDDGRWTAVNLPPAGSNWTTLFGVAVADGSVWPVGTFLDTSSGNNETLILKGSQEGAFQVVDAPNPGSGSNILGGIAATADTLWATGQFDDGGNRETLIERHQLP